MPSIEHVYRYLGGSTLEREREPATYLATSGGTTAHPYFFTGFLSSPRRDAALLLGVAKIGGTRFYTPTAAIEAQIRASDPVVTSDGDRLRFESFSVCNGVYSRLDLERLDADVRGVGSTNVDFNLPFQHLLSAVRKGELVYLSVGADEVKAERLAGAVTERRVDLPERWLRGFAEVALIQNGLRPVVELDKVRTRRFLSELARHPKTDETWLSLSRTGPVLSSEPGPDGIFIAGVDRLRPLAPFASQALGLQSFGSAEPESPSAWVLDLGDARFTIALSPARNRGFSAEGSVLLDLTDSAACGLAARAEPRVATGSAADLVGGPGAGASDEQLRASLGVMSAEGRVGFDVAESSWYVRDLPFDVPAPGVLHKRLRDARQIVEEAGVAVLNTDEGRATVRSGSATYDVISGDKHWSCTCKWATENASARGPCKHVLATRLTCRPSPAVHG